MLTNAILILFSASYFIIVTDYIMPALNVNHVFIQMRYSVLGKTTSDAFFSLIRYPFSSMKLLFINHTGNTEADGIKREFWLYFIFSGGILLLRKPVWLLMLIPVIFQKMFHDNFTMWSVCHQYVVEFAPIITTGAFIAVDGLNEKIKKPVMVIMMALSLAVTIRMMDRTILYYDKSTVRFYQKIHYMRSYDVKKVHDALKLIPPDAKVSAQSPFVPHLCLRKKIYQFPVIRDASYLVYSLNEAPYPLDTVSFNSTLDSLHATGIWKVLFNEADFNILKRQPD